MTTEAETRPRIRWSFLPESHQKTLLQECFTNWGTRGELPLETQKAPIRLRDFDPRTEKGHRAFIYIRLWGVFLVPHDHGEFMAKAYAFMHGFDSVKELRTAIGFCDARDLLWYEEPGTIYRSSVGSIPSINYRHSLNSDEDEFLLTYWPQMNRDR